MPERACLPVTADQQKPKLGSKLRRAEVEILLIELDQFLIWDQRTSGIKCAGGPERHLIHFLSHFRPLKMSDERVPIHSCSSLGPQNFGMGLLYSTQTMTQKTAVGNSKGSSPVSLGLHGQVEAPTAPSWAPDARPVI